MAAPKIPRGHIRQFSLSCGVSGLVECSHVRLDGLFTKFLWFNLYDPMGREIASACKLLPTNTRWMSSRVINPSTPMLQLLRELTPHRGHWVRIEFADHIGRD